MILVPGGIGTTELENDALIRFLQERCPQSQVTMSVCTGSLFFKAGLLDGSPAPRTKCSLNWPKPGTQCGLAESARWVDAGQYVTSSGVSAGTDAGAGCH